MALKIIIPGANFAALGNPKVEDYVEGLPGAGLSALYLFETGTAGQAYAGPATDYSGNGQAAPLIGASTAIKTAGGVGNVQASADAANNGFGVVSPVTISDKFTIFGVSRNLYASDANIGTFLIPWMSSGHTDSVSAPSTASGNFGQVNGSTDGRFHLNQANNVTGGPNAPELGAYSVQSGTGGAAWGGSGSTRPSTSTAGPKAAWIAWALSFDKTAGFTLRALGNSVVPAAGNAAAIADATIWANAQVGRGARHMFGAMNFLRDSDGVKGEIAMAGIYKDIAKSVAEMDVLLLSMKSRLAGRLGTVL